MWNRSTDVTAVGGHTVSVTQLVLRGIEWSDRKSQDTAWPRGSIFTVLVSHLYVLVPSLAYSLVHVKYHHAIETWKTGMHFSEFSNRFPNGYIGNRLVLAIFLYACAETITMNLWTKFWHICWFRQSISIFSCFMLQPLTNPVRTTVNTCHRVLAHQEITCN